jgi:hypothetical protein
MKNFISRVVKFVEEAKLPFAFPLPYHIICYSWNLNSSKCQPRVTRRRKNLNQKGGGKLDAEKLSTVEMERTDT